MKTESPAASRRFITSVLVPDRIGLLRDVTQSVFSLDGNIGRIRQTVVDGFFNLVFTSEHPGPVTPEALRTMLGTELDDDAVVTVLDCPETPDTAPAVGPHFVVMTRGKDKPGTILAITTFLGERGVNIEDWLVEQDDDDTIYIAQVVVPEAADFRSIQEGFREAMAERGLTAILCHENIFRATNEIGPIKALLN